MTFPAVPLLTPTLRKLERRAPLDDDDRRAFLDLPVRYQAVDPNIYLVREGDRPDRSCLLISGFAIRHKMTETGERQVLSFHVAGDFCDLEGALLNVADHNLQTLTHCELAFIPRSAVRDLILSHPRIGIAMWIDTLIDSSIFREWVVNVGRRDGRARIAHLLCEFARRMEVAGLADAAGYELPLTQEQIADATGLTAVHVNRVLKTLTSEGLIRRTRRVVSIPNWAGLRRVAGFNETYLHFDQVAGHPGVQPGFNSAPVMPLQGRNQSF
ncbi:Crp/Fnr family transcriptional regulator [Sphingopyxis sp. MSC1_008]|jgi:CRP-like cAMP-binding protein